MMVRGSVKTGLVIFAIISAFPNVTSATVVTSVDEPAADEEVDLVINGMDFTGDTVPMEAVELVVNYYVIEIEKENGSSPEILDDYWMPLYRLDGTKYGYAIIVYSGEDGPLPVDELIKECSKIDFLKSVKRFCSNDYRSYIVNTDYTDLNISSSGVGLRLTATRANADEIAYAAFNGPYESVKYVYCGGSSNPIYGYIYSDGEKEIYIDHFAAFVKKQIYCSEEEIEGFIETGYITKEGLPSSRFIKRTDEELIGLKDKASRVWAKIVKKILDKSE
jgi:hypothetical protein